MEVDLDHRSVIVRKSLGDVLHSHSSEFRLVRRPNTQFRVTSISLYVFLWFMHVYLWSSSAL